MFDCMLITIHSMSVEALEMSGAEAADALAPQAWDLMPDFRMMCDSGSEIFPVSSSAFP